MLFYGLNKKNKRNSRAKMSNPQTMESAGKDLGNTRRFDYVIKTIFLFFFFKFIYIYFT